MSRSRMRDGPVKDAVRSVAIGADHGAVQQKQLLVTYLGSLGYRVVDVGCAPGESGLS